MNIDEYRNKRVEMQPMDIVFYDYPLLYIFWYQVVDAEAINILSNRLSIYLLLNL